jgi:hypothetical protein
MAVRELTNDPSIAVVAAIPESVGAPIAIRIGINLDTPG